MTTLYCRLCANLISEYDLIDILGNKNGLESKILQCLQLQICEEDSLPKQACVECENKVCSYYTFHEQVMKAQVLLQSEIKPVVNSKCEETKCENENYDETVFLKMELDERAASEIDAESEIEPDVCISEKIEEPEIKTEEVKEKRTRKYTIRKKIEFKENETDIALMKEAFYNKLSTLNMKNNTNLLTDKSYERIIREIEEAKTKSKKEPVDYRRLSKFEVYEVNGTKKLIVPRTKSSQIVYYVPQSQIFEHIRNAHLECRHGGRTRTETILKTKYKNINRELVSVYINLCKICRTNRKTNGKRSANTCLSKKIISNKSSDKKSDHFSVTNYEWKCRDCNEILSTANDLNDHYESIHNKPVEYTCTECSQVFNSYIPFRNHLLKHRNKFRFRCEICNNFYSSARKLRNHKERHNQSRQKYFCATCGKGFLNESYLSVHEKRKHSGITEDKKEVIKPFECEECHKMFASISSLNNHKKVHVGVREHTCEHCGKSFIYKKYLDDHITSHSAERPFKCEICPASFKAKMYLRRHLYLHSGIRPYQCDICGKKFPRKPALTEHSITHTDLYPFKCEICDKGFRSKKNVVWHQRLHTGEKPYSCLMCNRHFTCSSNYDKHMKRHHGVVKVKKEFKYLK